MFDKRVFIGSSSERLVVTAEVERKLAGRNDLVVTPWHRAFPPSTVVISELVRIANHS
jgi:hypothetical protein